MVNFLFYSAVVLSLLSQLPMLLESGLATYLKLSWLPLTIFLLFLYPSSFFNRIVIPFFAFMVVFGGYCVLAQGCTGFNYFVAGSDYYNMAISYLIFVDSYVFWQHNSSSRIFKSTVLLILCACLLLGTIVYLFYLKDADITSTVYAFKAKNSMGQILFVGVILALCSKSMFGNKLTKIAVYLASLYLIIIIMQLRSRATILCLAFVGLYYLMRLSPSRIRIKLIFAIALILTIILLNPVTYELIVKNIIFASRNASSISSLSSGRSDLVMDSIYQILANPLLGNGNEYLDCMPVAMILQYGIFGASIVFCFIGYIAIKVNGLSNNSPLYLATFLLFWSYILNSLFEAYPPFGPGAKCFPLWMLLGFAFSKRIIHIPDRNHFTNKI